MNADEKRRVLAEHLERFRHWSYESFVKEIRRQELQGECLRHFEGVYSDGTEYQIEVNLCWDDTPGGNVRVMADITTPRMFDPAIRGYSSEATDSFIKTPDGSFVGE